MDLQTILALHCEYIGITPDQMLNRHDIQNTEYWLEINCGNGGDYEYYCDQSRWINWTTNNDFDCKFMPSPKGDQILVFFNTDEDRTRFMLIAPEYITVD